MATYSVVETEFNGALRGYVYGVYRFSCFWETINHLWHPRSIAFVHDSLGNSALVRIYCINRCSYVAVVKVGP